MACMGHNRTEVTNKSKNVMPYFLNCLLKLICLKIAYVPTKKWTIFRPKTFNENQKITTLLIYSSNGVRYNTLKPCSL